MALSDWTYRLVGALLVGLLSASTMASVEAGTAGSRPDLFAVGGNALPAQPLPEQPLILDGMVATVTADATAIATQGVTMTVPTKAHATLTRLGDPVVWRDLGVGQRIRVVVPPLPICAVGEGGLAFDLGDGEVWIVPAAALPADYKAATSVWMRDKGGRIVRVPLSAALTMPRSGFWGWAAEIAAPALDAQETSTLPPSDERREPEGDKTLFDVHREPFPQNR